MKQEEHFLTKLQSEEQKLLKLISTTFTHGSMIDVGAHHGVVTEGFLLQGWKAYAFEPVPANLEKLNQRLGENPNLCIRSEAVSDSSGYKNFNLALNKDNSLHEFYHSLEDIGEDAYHTKGQSIQIKTISLNDLVNRQEIPQRIEFLKIDTEGHDLGVLQGANQLECQVISVEFWCDKHALGVSPSPPDKMVQLLQKRGFDKYIVIEHKAECKTSYLYSSIENLEKDSWGNIFFFNSSQNKLYQDGVALCKHIESHNQAQQALVSLTKILTCLYSQNEEIVIIDVGAYQGDFTKGLMSHFPKSKAVLFEPSPDSFLRLAKEFTNDPNVRVFDIALSNYEGKDTFFLLEDGATNSLLLPIDQNPSELTIQVKTLDSFWQDLKPLARLDILKIDTQGNDLNVLQGARDIIKKYSPCLLVEVIFIDLYQSQNSYYEILDLMQKQGYSLVGIYNIHYTNEGQLAFADMFFLPNRKTKRISKNQYENFVCHAPEYLVVQNQLLQSICDERVNLINSLHQVAEDRLNVIHLLGEEVNGLQTELKRLSFLSSKNISITRIVRKLQTVLKKLLKKH